MRIVSILQNDGYQIIPNKAVTDKLYPNAVTMEGHNIRLILIPMRSGTTVQIFKPNNTHRWYAEKSDAQIVQALKQIRSFYEWR